MLVTDRFTYIHQPKTGGTFVASVLTALHEARGDRVLTVWRGPDSTDALPEVGPGLVLKLMSTTRNQHGARRDIPAQYTDRPVLATVRNPYDRYVSQFEFAWWRVYPEMFGPVEDVRRHHPAYPDLTFAEFVRLTNDRCLAYRADGHPDRTPGFHTQQFVEYFFADPTGSLPRLLDDGFASTVWTHALEGVRFLDQERLNDDLADVIQALDYSPAEVERVRRADRIWPPEGGRAATARWEPYYSAELKAYVRARERRLFEWFPAFDR